MGKPFFCKSFIYWFCHKTVYNKRLIVQIVVFFSTCDAVDFHHFLLSEFQWPPNSASEAESRLFLECKTYKLHGNMDHGERRSAFNEFKSEKSALLLSTDVSARGLDFPRVKCIIQYDSPGEATEYVHRFLTTFLEFAYWFIWLVHNFYLVVTCIFLIELQRLLY